MSAGLQPVIDSKADQAPFQIAHQESSDADWREICEGVKRRDAAKLKDYDSEIDTLLVFAGLFSAVLTAFIIDVYQDLKVDYQQNSADILRQILTHIQNGTDNHQLEQLPTASPSATVMVVMGFWFSSLSLSLLSALFSIFFKQWFHVYEKWTTIAHTNVLQGLALRGLYQNSISHWRVLDIFAALGVLLQVALLLFVIGLSAYLWTLDFIVSPIVTFFTVVMIVLSLLAILLPVFREDCPYKFPLAYSLVKLRTRGSGSEWTDLDLPIAQKSILCEDQRSYLTQAIAQTALLLDVEPGRLKAAFEHGDAEAMKMTCSRIRELSSSSVTLLSKVVTNKNLIDEDMDNETQLRLLEFWQTVFDPMPQTPSAIVHVVQYLGKQLTWEGGPKECSVHLMIRYMEVLGCIFSKCKALKSDEVRPDGLAQELTRIALQMHNCSRQTVDKDNECAITRLTLRAMIIAASCIPRDTAPKTGLSPITKFLPFLDALQVCIHDLASCSKYDVALMDLVHEGEEQVLGLSEYHGRFFCTRRRGFKSRNTDQPRVVSFTERGTLVVGTDERAAWELDPLSDDGGKLASISLPNDESNLSLFFARVTYDGKRICWGSVDGPLVLVDRLDSTTQVLRNIGQGKRARPAAYSHDNKYMLIVSETSSAAICDVATGKVVITLEGHGKRVCHAAFASAPLPAKSTAVGDDKAASYSNGEADEMAPPVPRPPVATSSCDNTVKIWDLETGTAIFTFNDVAAGAGVAWSSDAKLIAIAGNRAITVHNVQTREVLCTFEGHRKLVTKVAFSPNDNLLVTASNDETVRVWHIGKKTCIATLDGPDDDVNDVAFSPEGKFIAAAADDAIWIWDINERTQYSPLARRTKEYRSAETFRRAVHRVMHVRKALDTLRNDRFAYEEYADF